MINKVNDLIRPDRNKLIALFRLFDAYIIVLTLWLLALLLDVSWSSDWSIVLMIAILVFQLFAELGDVYYTQRGEKLERSVINLLFAWLFTVNILLIGNQFFLLVDSGVYRLFVYWAILVPIEMLSWHVILKLIIARLRAAGKNSRQAAIIGVTDLGKEVEKILSQPSLGIKFLGYYDSRTPNKKNARIQIDENKFLGDYKKLIYDANHGHLDIVYITLPMKAERRIKELTQTLADSTLSVYFVPDLFMFDLLRSQWTTLQGIPVVSIYDTPYSGIDGVLKRVFDIVVGSFILSLIIIPMLVIAVAIKLDSKGPILFKQRRYGLKGEEVIIWKFRSMTVCQDGNDVPQAKKGDARITRLGKFLRRTSLDELPQFINVLQGRMSIVGPRPHAVAHNEYYRKQIQGYMLRHKVKPGITGWAQINGYRGETDTLEKMAGRIQYDLDYIRNWSIWLDIKIIILTIFKGFTSSQAY